MPNTSLSIKVPGKLMIAGEFAVLEPYQKLVVTAVDRFVYATIEENDENLLTLENFNLSKLEWAYNNGEITICSGDERVRFVADAMTIATKYLSERSITPDNYMLTIRSELDDISGIKYGLGSSAAVVTSVVTAILKKNLPVSPPAPALIFKLAAISHVKTQGNGSGADVAASTYGGVLQYSSFQADWLLNEIKTTATITELLEKEWTYLSVKPIQLPKNIYMCVGWTGNPASTAKLVDKILELKTSVPHQFQQFLTDSEIAVNTFLLGVKENDMALLLEGVRGNRRSLSTVGKNANVEVETPLLQVLCDLATQVNGAGKPSGAGGGDCGIAFVSTKEQADRLFQKWETAGIKPLSIKSYAFGAAQEVNIE